MPNVIKHERPRMIARLSRSKRVAIAGTVVLVAALLLGLSPGATRETVGGYTEAGDYAARKVLGITAQDSTHGTGYTKRSEEIFDKVDGIAKKLHPDDVEKQKEVWRERLPKLLEGDYFSGFSRVEMKYEKKFRYADVEVGTDWLYREEERMGGGEHYFHKFERILNSLGDHRFDGAKAITTIKVPGEYRDRSGLGWAGVQENCPYVPREDPEGNEVNWSSEIPDTSELLIRYKKVGVPKDEYKPYLKRIREFLTKTIHRGPGIDFFRQYFQVLSEKYGKFIGYYEPMNEPGWGFNMIRREYDVSVLKEKEKYVFENYLQPDTPLYLYGWPTIDYPKLQQVAYDKIKKHDPGGKSYVISGSLWDEEAYVPGTDTSPPRENWDSYNRALDDTGRPGQEVSVRLKANGNVLCERPMYFNYGDRDPGGSCTYGAATPNKSWYFAEGCTLHPEGSPFPAFEEYICIQNPTEGQANIKVEYMMANSSVTRNHTVPGNSRKTIAVHAVDQAGPNQDVSVKVTSDKGIICERPMYFDHKGKYRGGHIVVGANKPGSEWYFAEGCTRGGFETWLCLQNPQGGPATVDITYMLDDGSVKGKTITVGARRRKTVDVNSDVGPGRDVSIKVTSDKGIICERPMYFEYPGRGNVLGCNGGHNTLGAVSPGKDWYFAEGCTRHADEDRKFEEWLCIQNPGDVETTARITCMTETSKNIETYQNLPPHSRVTVYVEGIDGVGHGQDVSVHVSAGSPIVCERPMYFNYTRKLRALRYNDTTEIKWKGGKGSLDNDFTNEKDRAARQQAAEEAFGSAVPDHLFVEQAPPEELRMNYHWAFYDDQLSGGHNVMGATGKGHKNWYFAEGAVGSLYDNMMAKDKIGNAFEEYICVMNPNDRAVRVKLYFQTADGQEIRGPGDPGTGSDKNYPYYGIPAKSRRTIKVNEELSFGRSCDAIGVHLFIRPEHWRAAYDSLRRHIQDFCINGYNVYSGKELVVGSCGWPHGVAKKGATKYEPLPDYEHDYTPEGQLRSIRCIADLMYDNPDDPHDVPCRKAWVYKDVDDKIPWDHYYGYFSYYATDENSMHIKVGSTTLWSELRKLLVKLPEVKKLPVDKKDQFDTWTVEEYIDAYVSE